MHPTQTLPAAPETQLPALPEPELGTHSTATPPAPTPPRPVKFRRLIVFDSLADAVGCGAHA